MMTLDDLELDKFEFSENFAEFRRFRMQQKLNEWRQTSIVNDNVVSNWMYFSTGCSYVAVDFFARGLHTYTAVVHLP